MTCNYQGDATTREKINTGVMEYQDMHLSHAGSLVRHGHYGKVHFALISRYFLNANTKPTSASHCSDARRAGAHSA